MTKNEYLAELKACLGGLPAEERDSALRYYEEFFEDAGEENAEDVIIQLGSPKALAESIISEQNFSEEASAEYIPVTAEPVCASEPKKNDSTKTVLIILLCVLFSPVILGLGGGAVGIIVGIIAAILGIVLAFGATALALAVTGLVLFGLGVTSLPALPWEGIALVGSSLIVLAVAMGFLLLFVLMCGKLIPAMVRGTVNLFRRLFVRPIPAMA